MSRSSSSRVLMAGRAGYNASCKRGGQSSRNWKDDATTQGSASAAAVRVDNALEVRTYGELCNAFASAAAELRHLDDSCVRKRCILGQDKRYSSHFYRSLKEAQAMNACVYRSAFGFSVMHSFCRNLQIFGFSQPLVGVLEKRASILPHKAAAEKPADGGRLGITRGSGSPCIDDVVARTSATLPSNSCE